MNLTPNSFVLIVDKDGDADDVCTMHDDIIQSVLREKDRLDPDYAPHVALVWNRSGWCRWD